MYIFSSKKHIIETKIYSRDENIFWYHLLNLTQNYIHDTKIIIETKNYLKQVRNFTFRVKNQSYSTFLVFDPIHPVYTLNLKSTQSKFVAYL